MGWSVHDVMPGSDGPENLKILKKRQLEGWLILDQAVGKLTLGHVDR